MTEKIYLITGKELAEHSHARMSLALDWVAEQLQQDPEGDLGSVLEVVQNRIDVATSEEEEWEYGAESVELNEPEEEPEVVYVEEEEVVYDEEPELETELETEADVETVLTDSYEPETELETEFFDTDEDIVEAEEPEPEPEVEVETVEAEPVIEYLPIDVEEAIYNVLNQNGSVLVNNLVAHLSEKFNEELISIGYWNLINNGTIVTDEVTGEVAYAPKEVVIADEAEETVNFDGATDDSADYFKTPASRNKLYRGLLREAGQIDRL